ncbi:sulfatase family protein [Pontiella sulfatireligans]|uniref:Arylsulfatase n=1 Tax=Pontiella sulfatireligans TaxID=2750658 RepID=A0A6C2UN97_9BACT|nr:arylsulfatase [Pontiella sulfatireligans]SPS74446.1 sulfatase S1_15 [Kiritimatiellales bacterium]VGO20794.1 Arylsulfatase [Pontiella sulfatireligans]
MKKINIQILSTIAASAVMSVADGHREAKPPEGRPNIIFILADDMGVGDVSGLNAQAKLATPHLDAMIRGGMKFTDAHTSSAVCTPTRYGLLTGRYNWRSELKGMVVNGYGKAVIAPDRSIVADILKSKGYKTAMIGKWHLGLNWKTKDGSPITDWTPPKMDDKIDFTQPFTGGPLDCGFDTYYGINASLDFPPYTFLNGDRVTVVPTELRPRQGRKKNDTLQLMMRGGLQVPGFRPEKVLQHFSEKAVAYIEAQQEGVPFFLYLPLNSPHTPVVPREEFKGTSQCGIYGDFVQEADWTVGQIVMALEKTGLLENTLLIFSADNGASRVSFSLEKEEQFDHHPSGIYRGRKGDLHEGGHRVPFIVQWPAAITPGTACDVPCNLNDFYATCAELVGKPLADTEAEDSFSMVPLLKGRSGGYSRTSMVHHDYSGQFGFRDGPWKLKYNRGGNYELHDLSADPAEKKNLYKTHPERVELMAKMLTKIVEDGRSTPGAPQKNDGPKWWEQLVWMEKR